MLELRGLSKTYSKKGAKAVDELSLSVSAGQIFGFLGPNGAGKTTTIKMLCGILKPDAGQALIDGKDINLEAKEAKRLFCYVPDSPELFVRLKAQEYLNFLGDVYQVPATERQTRIARYAALFKLEKVLHAPISSFSHGMKQKLLLLGSLLPDPQNWILDEPLVGLDPEAAYILKDIMRERAAAGKTVFFSTHVMEVAERLCDRLAVISAGKIVFSGSLDELKTRMGRGQGGTEDSLEKLFLELVDSDVAPPQGSGAQGRAP